MYWFHITNTHLRGVRNLYKKQLETTLRLYLVFWTGSALRGVWGCDTPPGPVSVGKFATSLGKIVEFPWDVIRWYKIRYIYMHNFWPVDID